MKESLGDLESQTVDEAASVARGRPLSEKEKRLPDDLQLWPHLDPSDMKEYI